MGINADLVQSFRLFRPFRHSATPYCRCWKLFKFRSNSFIISARMPSVPGLCLIWGALWYLQFQFLGSIFRLHFIFSICFLFFPCFVRYFLLFLIIYRILCKIFSIYKQKEILFRTSVCNICLLYNMVDLFKFSIFTLPIVY